MEFKDKLKQIRICNGLTQEQLAKKSGITVTTINRLENGMHVPSPMSILCISRAFCVDVSFFMDEENKNAPINENISLIEKDLKEAAITRKHFANIRKIKIIIDQIEKLKICMVNLMHIEPEDENQAEGIAGDIEDISEKIRILKDKMEKYAKL